MAHHKSSLKRARQDVKRNAYNRSYKRAIKEATKAVLQSPDLATAEARLRDAAKVLDRSAAHGVIHKNTASNRKSGLANYVNKISRGEIKPYTPHH
jgi:small subunit ribosomal protein S20